MVQHRRPARARFVDVRTAEGRLAFRFAPAILCVEWQDRDKRLHYFYLGEVQEPEAQDDQDKPT